MERLDSGLMQPIGMTPFLLTDSLSPSFEDFKNNFALGQSKQSLFNDNSLIHPPSLVVTKAIPDRVITVLAKAENQRTTGDNNVLYRYVFHSKLFKDLSKQLSSEVAKQILKEGKIRKFRQGDLLCACGKKVKQVLFLLHGSVGIVFEEEEAEEQKENKDLWSTLHCLVGKLGKETRSFKMKNKKNLSDSVEKLLRVRNQLMGEFVLQNLTQIQNETILDYSPLVQYDPRSSKTLVATTDFVLVYSISLDAFYQSLLVFYTSKQSQLIKMFRQVPLFNNFQNFELKLLVDKLNITEMKKHQYVFQEGDQATSFYLLTQGQIELTKTVDLLEENPNNLYKNRVKVGRERGHLNLKMLPYANFKGVYNYQQQTKIVTLSQLTPICLFGQEELITGTTREVSAKIISLTAKMYELTLSDVQDFIGKITTGQNEPKMTLVDFFAVMDEGITMKKILLRQNQLSDTLYHENKTRSKNLLEERKDKLRNRRSASTGSNFKKIRVKEDQAPPTFNNFNFTEFVNQNEQEYQTLPSTLSVQENRVMELTHTKAMKEESPSKSKHKDKVIRLRNVSKQTLSKIAERIQGKQSLLQPKRSLSAATSSLHKITLQDPLFTMNYFRKKEEWQKKLVVKAKKNKLENIYRNSKC